MPTNFDSGMGDWLNSWRGLLVLGLLAAANLFPAVPYQSNRPDTTPLPIDPKSEGDEHVPARLWQDPLEAVYSYVGPTKTTDVARASRRSLSKWPVDASTPRYPAVVSTPDSRDGKAISMQIDKRIGETGSNRLLVLPVFMSGGGFAANRESRLRLRYSVVAALGVRGFVPEDGRRLGYFSTTHGGKIVPYEWFRRKAKSADSDEESLRWSYALILWINEDLLSTTPVRILLVVLHDIFCDIDDISTLDVRVIAPGSSTVLINFLRDWHKSFPLIKPSARRRLAPAVQRVRDLGERQPGCSGVGLETLTDRSRNGGPDDESLCHPDWSSGAEPEIQEVLACSSFRALETTSSKFTCEIYVTSATVPDSKVYNQDSARKDTVLSLASNAKPKWAHSAYALLLYDELTCEEFQKPSSRPCPHWTLYRTIGDDKQLVKALLKEIDLRRRPRLRKHLEVAIFAEWDTDYGRAWRHYFSQPSNRVRMESRTLERDADKKRSGHAGPQKAHCERECYQVGGVFLKRPLYYPYLTGLDGKTTNPTSKQVRTSGEGDDEDFKAEGRNQFDYIHRLLNMGELSCGKDRFDAICILGSDVYDKLVLAGTLRNHFPKALIATTDLDARYLNPETNAVTRNLIVASHYGLSLKEPLQQPIPPFRHSYQTATFFGSLLALDHPHAREFDSPPARIYEIGRTAVFDLSHFKDTPRDPNMQHSRRILGNLDPPQVLGLLLAMILGSFVLLPFSTYLRSLYASLANFFFVASFAGARKCSVEVFSRHRTFWNLSACILLFGSVLWIDSSSLYGEPLAFFEGISVWPSDLIRVLAIGLCTSWILEVLNGTDKEILQVAKNSKDFGGEVAVKILSSPKSALSCLRWNSIREFVESVKTAVGRIVLHDWSGELGTPKIKVEEFWKMAGWKAKKKHRLWRSLFCAVCFFFMGLILFWAFGFPARPTRGAISGVFDLVVILLSVFLMLLLTFLVLDSVHLVERFARLFECDCIDLKGESVSRSSESTLGANEAWSVHCVRIMADVSEKLGKYLFLPSFMFLLIVLSRLEVFDNWQWDWPLLFVVFLTFAVLVLCLVLLLIAARRVRRNTEECLREATGLDEELRKNTIKEIEADFQRGAFRPIWQQPIAQVVLIPLAGSGTVSIFDTLFG